MTKEEYYKTKDVKSLRWECEMVMSYRCYQKENPNHKCDCPNPDNWDRETCLKYLLEKE